SYVAKCNADAKLFCDVLVTGDGKLNYEIPKFSKLTELGEGRLATKERKELKKLGKGRHPERRRAGKFLSYQNFSEPQSKDLAPILWSSAAGLKSALSTKPARFACSCENKLSP